LHPGVTYRIGDIKATLKIFSTGSITITAPSVDSIQSAVETIYPLVFEYKNERRRDDIEQFPLSERRKRRRENQLLKKQNGTSSSSKGSQPPKKKAKHNGYGGDDFINDDDEEENVSAAEEEVELKCFKSPVDESEEECESDASHD
jgi:hypothetical protein